VELTLAIVALVVIGVVIALGLRGGPPRDDGDRAGDSTGVSRYGDGW